MVLGPLLKLLISDRLSLRSKPLSLALSRLHSICIEPKFGSQARTVVVCCSGLCLSASESSQENASLVKHRTHARWATTRAKGSHKIV